MRTISSWVGGLNRRESTVWLPLRVLVWVELEVCSVRENPLSFPLSSLQKGPLQSLWFWGGALSPPLSKVPESLLSMDFLLAPSAGGFVTSHLGQEPLCSSLSLVWASSTKERADKLLWQTEGIFWASVVNGKIYLKNRCSSSLHIQREALRDFKNINSLKGQISWMGVWQQRPGPSLLCTQHWPSLCINLTHRDYYWEAQKAPWCILKIGLKV